MSFKRTAYFRAHLSSLVVFDYAGSVLLMFLVICVACIRFCILCQMLPVSLNFLVLIVSSVFSNICLLKRL